MSEDVCQVKNKKIKCPQRLAFVPEPCYSALMEITAERAIRHAEACESLARTITGSQDRKDMLLAEAAEWRAIAAKK